MIIESHYTNPDDLEITTIEDVVYMGMRNDLSFIIGDEMNLYEHQSTFCPNLPLRGLFYFSSVYKAYTEPMKHKLYSTSELKIPFPQYIVFYNGIEEKPERQELKLSSLFIGNGKGKAPALECTALVLNVNYGQNKELMERCKTLKEYAQFIAIIRRNLATGMKHQESVEQAIDKCVQNDILAEILRKNRSEIMNSILTEWDENEYREFLKEESWKDGHESGKLEGMREGIIEMIKLCQEFQVPQNETLLKIKNAFSLEDEDARHYIDEYWK